MLYTGDAQVVSRGMSTVSRKSHGVGDAALLQTSVARPSGESPVLVCPEKLDRRTEGICE